MTLIKDRIYYFNHITAIMLEKQKFLIDRSTIYVNVHAPHIITHCIDHRRRVMKLRRYYSTTEYTLYKMK